MTNQTATLSPARSKGGLTVKGDYTQRLRSTLELTLGGDIPGTNQSRLKITGQARLGGTVDVRLAPGYLPNPGTSFEVLTFASRAGDFSAYGGFFFPWRRKRIP